MKVKRKKPKIFLTAFQDLKLKSFLSIFKYFMLFFSKKKSLIQAFWKIK